MYLFVINAGFHTSTISPSQLISPKKTNSSTWQCNLLYVESSNITWYGLVTFEGAVVEENLGIGSSEVVREKLAAKGWARFLLGTKKRVVSALPNCQLLELHNYYNQYKPRRKKLCVLVSANAKTEVVLTFPNPNTHFFFDI